MYDATTEIIVTAADPVKHTASFKEDASLPRILAEISLMALYDSEGWLSDIEFVRKPNGDRQRIGKGGAGDVFHAKMKMRDENDDIIEGKLVDVAANQFTVKRVSRITLRLMHDWLNYICGNEGSALISDVTKTDIARKKHYLITVTTARMD